MATTFRVPPPTVNRVNGSVYSNTNSVFVIEKRNRHAPAAFESLTIRRDLKSDLFNAVFTGRGMQFHRGATASSFSFVNCVDPTRIRPHCPFTLSLPTQTWRRMLKLLRAGLIRFFMPVV